MKQTLVNGAASAVGMAVTYWFGSWSELLGFFLLAIAIDYGTGIAASIAEGKGMNSKASLKRER